MMRINISAIALAAAMSVLAGCQNDGPEPRFDPRALGDPQRQVADQYTTDGALRPLPTTLESKFLPENRNNPNAPKEPPASSALQVNAKIVKLPLREIAQRAVANNRAVKVSGYQPAIDETRVTEAEARFDPEFFAGATFEARRQDSEFGFSGTNFDQWRLEAGLRQLLPTGGQVELKYGPNRTGFLDQFGESQKAYTAEIGLQLTQPLLRDFGLDVNRARIVINQNNQRISVLDFRKDLEEVLRNIEETYWRQVQARETVRIQEELLQRTIDFADIVSNRFGQDTTMEQISTSISRVEAARESLIQARQRVMDLSDQLKNLMNDPEYPVAGGTLLLPADEPLMQAVAFDFSDNLSTALLNRLELGQQQLRVDSASVAMKVAKNNKLPQLNLVGSLGFQGLGEDYFDSHDPIWDTDNVSWSLGLQFVQKIGNREAESIFRRAQLQRMQAIAQYEQLIDQVTTEVKTAQREVEASWQSIGQTRKARFAAAKALETLQTLRINGEPLTPNFVERELSRQQEVAGAERAEAESVARYNIALSRLEGFKCTLLRYNNVLLEEAKR